MPRRAPASRGGRGSRAQARAVSRPAARALRFRFLPPPAVRPAARAATAAALPPPARGEAPPPAPPPHGPRTPGEEPRGDSRGGQSRGARRRGGQTPSEPRLSRRRGGPARAGEPRRNTGHADGTGDPRRPHALARNCRRRCAGPEETWRLQPTLPLPSSETPHLLIGPRRTAPNNRPPPPRVGTGAPGASCVTAVPARAGTPALPVLPGAEGRVLSLGYVPLWGSIMKDAVSVSRGGSFCGVVCVPPKIHAPGTRCFPVLD
ncbi:basic proline-rich protein-like [Balaenoptera musculus]|uniref:Basic proline-rich protein-like n=1 Tax=Balaenoptera musculus TaxID=9771 RepID=A0A8B8V421_BALMU|nr:basic proline-rich protein-like [Balaenoptera musculus]XP_036679571.1 basic proline-rich protein-like [Balaenoptera musculus]